MAKVQDEDAIYDEINVVPMLDLAYVLIVIFILMATAQVSGIEALKARIDAVSSDQAYTLSDRLVILTLSIAGGPFLGLLGTVIGVMITFAAIAAEGNVNVNSIAPGVAAALLATAAGLAVAIPALFGYNLIVTRIKRINAKNRSFADALVARIAEQYGS